MSHTPYSDLDTTLTAVVRESRIARALRLPLRAFRLAWPHSQVRQRGVALRAGFRSLPGADRLRAVAITIGVAVVVHFALVLVDARTVESLALLVPATAGLAALVMYLKADQWSRWLKDPRP